MEYEVVRDVTIEECHWLYKDVKQGTIVYKFHGHTYGCIGSGIAVTLEEGENPFFELPKDSIKEIKEKETMVND